MNLTKISKTSTLNTAKHYYEKKKATEKPSIRREISCSWTESLKIMRCRLSLN